MPFSLFECKDGTFVVVPRGLAPPLPAYQAHGESIHLSDLCRHLYDTTVWDDVSREVDRQLYAVVHPEVAFHLFELPGAIEGAMPPTPVLPFDEAAAGAAGRAREGSGRPGRGAAAQAQPAVRKRSRSRPARPEHVDPQ